MLATINVAGHSALQVMAQSNTTMSSNTSSATPTAASSTSSSLDCKSIASRLGSSIAIPNGDVCDVVLVRQSPNIVAQDGMVQNKFTLMNSVLEFTPAGTMTTTSSSMANSTAAMTSGRQVFVMGDFALLESEVNPVLKVIVPAGWTIDGVHNHMIQETPKILFMHWTAQGNLDTIINTIKQALSNTTIPHGA